MQQKIWFTSDLHLGHRNIAGPKVTNWKDGYRDFEQANQMDAKLLETLNSLVEEHDVLYFLGDFSFSKEKQGIQQYRDRIVCKDVRFIKGNHDKRKEIVNVFGHCHDYLEEDFCGVKFCMFHYAQRIWNKSHHGAIHLYGHSHSKLEDQPWGRSMDVGIDNAFLLTGEYRPFSLEEILKIMEKREPKLVDHHGTSKNTKDEIRTS